MTKNSWLGLEIKSLTKETEGKRLNPLFVLLLSMLMLLLNLFIRQLGQLSKLKILVSTCKYMYNMSLLIRGLSDIDQVDYKTLLSGKLTAGPFEE